ncbi:MAG: primosomal protein N', partial [Cyanothece sp. SIO2G6]|nr:primosomal protein N' [Cyanothece sp. SIO2G6]
LPIPHLGIIILDEEHDSSFKQDRPAPCYHARTVAQWRSQLASCPLLLGSATPALDTWTRVKNEERRAKSEERRTKNEERRTKSEADTAQSSILDLQSSILNPRSSILNPRSSILLSLPTRVHDRPHPPIHLIDMRREFLEGHRSIFSRALMQALGQLRETGQQGILFIHRRGHSTFVSCRSCGHVLECPDCDVSLTYHHTQAAAVPYLRCHYCGQGRSHPSHCPECGSPYLKHFGSGTQRVTQELTKLFPDLRFIRYDSDTTRTKGAHRALINQFAQGDADILVGTQMLTKGIDIPHVTLVGVIAADGLLHMADYRAGERTYQTLTQVAGRAGRGEQSGRVIIQTYTPSHPILMAIQQQQPYEFVMNYELEQRAALNYPPYSQFIVLKLSGADPTAVQQTAEKIAARIQPESLPESQCSKPQQPEPQNSEPQQADGDDESMTYELLGPAPAAILRVARRFRWQILLKCPLGMTEAIATHLRLTDLHRDCPVGVSLTIDIDPLNLL